MDFDFGQGSEGVFAKGTGGEQLIDAYLTPFSPSTNGVSDATKKCPSSFHLTPFLPSRDGASDATKKCPSSFHLTPFFPFQMERGKGGEVELAQHFTQWRSTGKLL